MLQWGKYNALNIAPLWGDMDNGVKALGTIEFRHMEGTTDINRIIEWINLIVSLKIYTKKSNTEDLLKMLSTMNSTSDYNYLVVDVFKKWSRHLTEQPTFKTDVESGITTAKECTMDRPMKAVEIVIPFNTKKGTN